MSVSCRQSCPMVVIRDTSQRPSTFRFEQVKDAELSRWKCFNAVNTLVSSKCVNANETCSCERRYEPSPILIVRSELIGVFLSTVGETIADGKAYENMLIRRTYLVDLWGRLGARCRATDVSHSDSCANRSASSRSQTSI